MTGITSRALTVSEVMRLDFDGGAGGNAVPLGVSVLVVTLVVALALVLGLKIHYLRLERLVRSASVALQRLAELNELSAPHLRTPSRLKHVFPVRVESKSKFDRFDLGRYMADSILEYEGWFASEIAARMRVLELFSGYEVSVRRLEVAHLGSSAHPRLDTERFVRMERKLFERRQISAPKPSARIVAEVTYTSPAGRNSYSRRLEWNFDQLRQGMNAARALRVRASTTEALRARERSLMTSSLRVDIMRRDGYRCQMCGASKDEGVTLHVDHILPVSRGGRTVAQNLQTLCQPCNLGKSNRFVG